MRVEAAIAIGRPVAVVWDFVAVHHVENHPRWDPTIELERTSDGPINVGTVIKRRTHRFGHVTEGLMEVIQFDPGSTLRMRVQDGPNATDGWMVLEPQDANETRLTIGGDIPGIDAAMADQIRTMMQGSVTTIRQLIESET